MNYPYRPLYGLVKSVFSGTAPDVLIDRPEMIDTRADVVEIGTLKDDKAKFFRSFCLEASQSLRFRKKIFDAKKAALRGVSGKERVDFMHFFEIQQRAIMILSGLCREFVYKQIPTLRRSDSLQICAGWSIHVKRFQYDELAEPLFDQDHLSCRFLDLFSKVLTEELTIIGPRVAFDPVEDGDKIVCHVDDRTLRQMFGLYTLLDVNVKELDRQRTMYPHGHHETQELFLRSCRLSEQAALVHWFFWSCLIENLRGLGWLGSHLALRSDWKIVQVQKPDQKPDSSFR